MHADDAVLPLLDRLHGVFAADGVPEAVRLKLHVLRIAVGKQNIQAGSAVVLLVLPRVVVIAECQAHRVELVADLIERAGSPGPCLSGVAGVGRRGGADHVL